MYPGLNDTDWQVAMFRHRQSVAEGQYQQFVASTLAPTAGHSPGSATIRQQLGTALMRTGKRLLGAHASTGRSSARRPPPSGAPSPEFTRR